MKKITEEECKQRLLSVRNGEYELVGNYSSFTKKALIKHKCGHIWETIPKTIYSGIASCPICSGHVCDNNNIINILKSKNVSIINLHENEQINTKNKYKLKCDICGYEWETTLSSFLSNMKKDNSRTFGCPKCYNIKHMRLSAESYKERFNNNCNDFELLSDYIKSDEKLLYKCKKCGHEFYRYPADIFRYGCPCCNNTLSGPENEIYEYIKKYYPNTKQRDKTILNGKEIDIYIPDLKIGIEFDGLYWHSDCNIDKMYHYNKMISANKLGIRLINIFEDEYHDHKEIVLNKLEHILKKSSKEKIYGRKCKCKSISVEDKNKFLDENHIQGHDAANIYYGAYYDEILVAVMTFSKPKLGMGNKSIKNSYELSRFATNINYNVIGIFGKLLKKFIKEHKSECSEIYSFADLRWVDSKSNIYLKNNFINVCENKPTYYYCKSGKRYHRFGFRKSILKTKFPDVYDKKLTEFEIMDKSNFYRIWDCGNIKYILKI